MSDQPSIFALWNRDLAAYFAAFPDQQLIMQTRCECDDCDRARDLAGVAFNAWAASRRTEAERQSIGEQLAATDTLPTKD